MKHLTILPLLFLVNAVYAQNTPKTEARLLLEKSTRSLYLITKIEKTKTAIVSNINFDVQYSYKDAGLNKRIEKEIESNWKETLEERGYTPNDGISYLYTNYYSVTGAFTTDEFMAMRKKNMTELRNKGYRVVEESYVYFPSSEIASVLSQEKIKLDAMTTIEDNRDANKAKYGQTVADVTSITSTALLAAMDNDDEDNLLPWYIKANIGFGLQKTPMIINSVYTRNNSSSPGESKVESEQNMLIHSSLLFSLRNDKMVSFRLQPFFNYGFYTNLISEVDEKGLNLNYGTGAAVGFGKGFKFLVKGEFAKRNGHVYRTVEVPSYNSTSEETGEYNYHTFKYGAGLNFDFGGHDTFFEMSAYKESPSLQHKGSVTSYEVKLSLTFLAIAYQFASDYPTGGFPEYWSDYNGRTSGYSNVYIYVPLTIGKKK